MGTYVVSCAALGVVSGLTALLRRPGYRYAAAGAAALWAIGLTVFAAKLTWFPSPEQRLEMYGRHAVATIVRITSWDRTNTTPRLSYGKGAPTVEVPKARRALVRYPAGPRPAESDIALGYLFDAQFVNGTNLKGVAVRVVYDPAHPAIARAEEEVDHTPGRVAAAWEVVGAFAITGGVSAGIVGLVTAGFGWREESP